MSPHTKKTHPTLGVGTTERRPHILAIGNINIISSAGSNNSNNLKNSTKNSNNSFNINRKNTMITECRKPQAAVVSIVTTQLKYRGKQQ